MRTVHMTRKQKITLVIFIISVAVPLYLLTKIVFPSKHKTSAAFSNSKSFLWSRTGLEGKDGKFMLNGKQFTIYSGALHYFRVVPEYWEDRMTKMKAAGLNTVETYVPWNLHEEIRGRFNFNGILDLRSFVKEAQNKGLHVIVRPGPYICSEWEFGGLPSWLLHDPKMKVRSSYPAYLETADRYLEKVIKEVEDLQYQKGGPIIAFQIENEYGAYGSDKEYLKFLKERYVHHGVKELLFTSDNGKGSLEKGGLPGVLMTANFKKTQKGKELFSYLRKAQPGQPLMAMEFWSGWFDHWTENHHTLDSQEMLDTLEYILEEGASVNFYMFHGGTNFGFMNGANDNPYAPTITSYDYDAPLSEGGDPTEKYIKIRKFLSQYTTIYAPPLSPQKYAYGEVKMTSYLTFDKILSQVAPIKSSDTLTMEMLDINNGGGQGYGYTVYRTKLAAKTASVLSIDGGVHDYAIVMADGKELDTIKWDKKDPDVSIEDVKDQTVLDILVENLGRVNYASHSNSLNQQRKGLHPGTVFVDQTKLTDWQIFPLEFKTDFVKGLSTVDGWKPRVGAVSGSSPTLYKGVVKVEGAPKDSFLDMQGWVKGVVFINSFNLGRYWNVGPQKTLYVPAPLLHTGENEVLVFELHASAEEVVFTNKPRIE